MTGKHRRPTPGGRHRAPTQPLELPPVPRWGIAAAVCALCLATSPFIAATTTLPTNTAVPLLLPAQSVAVAPLEVESLTGNPTSIAVAQLADLSRPPAPVVRVRHRRINLGGDGG